MEATTLDELAKLEDQLPFWMVTDPDHRIPERFPWFVPAAKIAADQGFFHWELDFAHVFAGRRAASTCRSATRRGSGPGGTPTPCSPNTNRGSSSRRSRQRTIRPAPPAAAQAPGPERYVLGELTATTAQVAFFGSPQVIRSSSAPSPTCTGRSCARSGRIRLSPVRPGCCTRTPTSPATRRAPCGRRPTGGCASTATSSTPASGSSPSLSATRRTSASTSTGRRGRSASTTCRGWCPRTPCGSPAITTVRRVPGIRYRNGEFDERPHRTRVVTVDETVLAIWRRLLDEEDQPLDQARLLFPVSTGEAAAIEALAAYPHRLAALGPQISSGFHESGAKKARLIDYNRVDRLPALNTSRRLGGGHPQGHPARRRDAGVQTPRREQQRPVRA